MAQMITGVSHDKRGVAHFIARVTLPTTGVNDIMIKMVMDMIVKEARCAMKEFPGSVCHPKVTLDIQESDFVIAAVCKFVKSDANAAN